MDKNINILILEDNVHDRELVGRELKKGGLTFALKGVNSKKDFTREISEFKPDIILSDYMLPDINAIGALEIVLKQAPETPVIVVTGSVSEEVAAECIKLGAADYVVKEHLVRLVPAVKNALIQKKAKKDKKVCLDALLKSEEKYKKLFDNMLNGFALHKIIVDENNKPIDYIFLDANKKFEELTGLKVKDIIGERVTEVLPGIEKEPADWIGKYGEVALFGKEIWFEQYSEAIDKWFSIAAFSSEKNYFAVLIEDITERKQAEEKLRDSERKSRAYLENSPVCTKIVDLDFNLQYMSAAGVEGLKIDDITPFYGKPYPFDFYPEAFRNTMTKNLEKVKETGEIITQEAPVVDVDGNEVWFHSTLVPVNDDEGRIEYIIVVSADVTERKKAEEVKNKTLEELQKFKDVTIGRELQMIELKKEINKLSKELGRQEPYDVSFSE